MFFSPCIVQLFAIQHQVNVVCNHISNCGAFILTFNFFLLLLPEPVPVTSSTDKVVPSGKIPSSAVAVMVTPLTVTDSSKSRMRSSLFQACYDLQIFTYFFYCANVCVFLQVGCAGYACCVYFFQFFAVGGYFGNLITYLRVYCEVQGLALVYGL